MIVINGKSFSGNSISIYGNKVIIDGKDCTPDSKEINITVNGNLSKLKADVCNTIQINGDCGNVQTQSGDVEIEGAVSGSVSTMSGDVDCGDIGGNVSTMSGDIKQRRR